ncbi:TPA_asm: DUF932 domain-containing protein [Salmonella enterica subsp. enterica serovar Enteritidis]|nr:DUF932 domain-containing protein [Salmonella enterica subsp. enterica serovar Enteritidis]
MDWYADHFGEIRVPHKGDIVGQVIEGDYEVMGIFDKATENFSGLYLCYSSRTLSDCL